jgi:hypothetical protein
MNEKEVLNVNEIEILKTLDSVNVDCITLKETISEHKEEVENGQTEEGILDKLFYYCMVKLNGK